MAYQPQVRLCHLKHLENTNITLTSWTGTLQKLGLPGLLFHHVIPTKDYFHDKLQPYVHYLPIKEDLSDLKDMYDWAESHVEEAKQISENAIQFVRRLGTKDGMAEMFDQFYDMPLRQVIDAYQPVPLGLDWRETMVQLQPVMTCGGYHSNDCKSLRKSGLAIINTQLIRSTAFH